MLQMEILWRLQCVDREIHMLKKNKKLKDLQDCLVKTRDSYNSLKTSVEEGQLHKARNERESVKLNAELEELDRRLKESSRRLYQDGQNIKAAGNLQKEIDTNKSKVDEIENKLLKNIEVGETLEADKKDKKKMLSSCRDEFNRLKAIYDEENMKNKASIGILEAQREEILKEVAPEILSRYTFISQKKVNAVSKVEGGICMECGVTLNASLYDSLKKKNQICCCEYCGRILYYD